MMNHPVPALLMAILLCMPSCGVGTRPQAEVDDTGGLLPVQQELRSPVPITSFGGDVALDGDVALVGALGAAFVFRRGASGWAHEQMLVPPVPTDGFYGGAVALSGDVAVVAGRSGGQVPGAAFVFRYDGTTWAHEQTLSPAGLTGQESFASSLDVEGDTIVVGAPLFDPDEIGNAGVAFVFLRTRDGWTQLQVLQASDAHASQLFGSPVALSGRTLVVGAVLDDESGEDAGAAYVFTRDGVAWQETQKLLPVTTGADTAFAADLAISGDVIAIAARWEEAVYAYERDDVFFSLRQRLDGGSGTNAFGTSVAVEGTRIAVGELELVEGYYGGSVFDRVGPGWSQSFRLRAADGGRSDAFGGAVGISAGRVIAGAAGRTHGDGRDGAAFVQNADP